MSTAGRIVVIGEAVADAFPRYPEPAGEPAGGRPATAALTLEVRPGGSPANTAVGLARLGAPTAFLGRLSGGLLGRLLRAHLAASGVDLSASVAATGTAALAIAALDPDGRASYDFYLQGATDWQWTGAELAAHLPADACCLHTGSLALALPPGGPLIERALAGARGQATICVDPNIRPGLIPVDDYRAGIARWVEVADIVRLSDEDLAVLEDGADFDRACARWHAAGVRLVVLTRGPDGALASLDGTRVEVPAVPVDVVDTVGAGDSFTAGLLHSLWSGGHLAGRLSGTEPDDVRTALAFAVAVAARTCAVPGADPPWAGELGLS